MPASTPPAEAPSLPVYVAQTSPLNPAAAPSEAASEPFAFPSAAFNLAQAARQLARASETGAGVCVLPEYGLQGIIPDHSAYALAAPHLLVALQALCQRYRLAAVTTLVEPHQSEGARPPARSLPESPFVFAADGLTLEPVESSLRAEWAAYAEEAVDAGFESVNSAYYISAEGDIVGRYEKANLWHPERDYLRPGSEPSAVFNTPWGKAGLVICWDLSHPEAVQSLVRRGAEIVFAPTYWLSTDSDPIQRKYTPKAPLYDHTLLPSLAFIRAFEGECLLVMANPGVGTTIELPGAGPASGSPAAALERWGRALVGRDNTYDRGFFGQSGVWAPLAGKMVDAGVDEGACEGVLSLEVIRDARSTYKIVEEAHMRAKAKRDGPLASDDHPAAV